MDKLRVWLRSSRGLVLMFVLVTILPAAALVVLGVRLVDQERALAGQRRRDALDRAADRAVLLFTQELTRLHKRLAGPPFSPPVDSAVLVFRHRGNPVEAIPDGRLPYLPAVAGLNEPPPNSFSELETFEFSTHNLDKAIELSRRLAQTSDPAVRAGALLRQARVLRKLGRIDDALDAYRNLSEIRGVGLGGIPIDLVALRARCTIWEERSQSAFLRTEAATIQSNLRQGRWPLDRASYDLVTSQLSRWLNVPVTTSADTAALAAATDWLYRQWADPNSTLDSQGVRSGSFNQTPVLIAWRAGGDSLTALVAGPQFVENEIAAAARKALRPAEIYLSATGEKFVTNEVLIRRTPGDTGLPWTILLKDAGPSDGERARGRLWQAGFAALVLLVGAGTYLIGRAVSRELAVARLQSDFVSAVSHEFRTPLTSLRHLNHLLLEPDEPPPPKRHSYYRAQQRATERLHHLVESLLDFGRMEAGKHPYHFEPLDAGALARDVTEEFAAELEDRGFVVDCRLGSEACPVMADPEAIARGLWNLLDNAAKYSGDSRKIDVAAFRRDNNSVNMSVRDYGPGIAADEQQRVFNKFVRGHAARSRGIKGTGIGLAMVRHIAKAHGGTVELSSTPGAGSTFTIVLPLAKLGKESK